MLKDEARLVFRVWMQMARLIWIFYVSKMYEFMDTVRPIAA